MRRGKQTALLVVVIAFSLLRLISADPPELHAIQGYVHLTQNTQVPSDTTVTINATSTGTYKIISTSGPPGNTGFYATNILASNGELVIVTAYNATHFGRNTSTISNTPTTTYLNITFNSTRPAETNLTILSPSNNTIFDRFARFNVTFNVSAIGGANSIDCNVSLQSSNPAVINVTTNANTTSLGNINLGSSQIGLFEFEALNEGTVTITLFSICASDGENFENQNIQKIIIRVSDQPPQLHALQGYVLNINNVSQAAAGTNVTINLTRTGQIIKTQTSGPPGNTGFYATNILARDGDEVFIYAQNGTFEGNTTINLAPSQSVTRVNVTLNTKKTPIDLMINSTSIIFNYTLLIEGINVTINTTIWNIGRGDLYNVLVSFYRNDPNAGGTLIGNKTISYIPFESSRKAELSFVPAVGPNNIFVLVDPPLASNGSINESDESNNQANNTFHLPAWQDLYGNITFTRILASFSNSNISAWENVTAFTGNLFIVDTESDISWSSLQAMHKNTTSGNTTNDFTDVDTLLNMTSFSDSVANTFTTDGNVPIALQNFVVHNQIIQDVPIINSTNTSNFITGILWDTSDDTNGQYSITDKEDLVFVTKINQQASGAYGTYDYEITIPVNLREYFTFNTQDVYIYYDIN